MNHGLRNLSGGELVRLLNKCLDCGASGAEAAIRRELERRCDLRDDLPKMGVAPTPYTPETSWMETRA